MFYGIFFFSPQNLGLSSLASVDPIVDVAWRWEQEISTLQLLTQHLRSPQPQGSGDLPSLER